MFSISSGFGNGSSRDSTLILPLLSAVGFSVSITESCNDDAEEVGVDDAEEFVDKPGTTNGAQFGFVAINSLAIFGEMWFLTAGPVVSVPMILTELPEGKNCGSFFKKHHLHE